MKYKIMIHPMPENCDNCPLNYDMISCRCDSSLNVSLYPESGICRHPNCPLIPAEPWRFKTCETCGLKNRVLTSNPPQVCKNIMTVKGTCKEWRAK